MLYTVYINILPHDEILDPAGKATLQGLHHMHYTAVADVRIGKRIRLRIEAPDAGAALALADEAAKKLLVNAIMERYELEQPLPA